MTSINPSHPEPGMAADAWTWWQQRRLRYNLALASAGWIAYGASLGLAVVFGRPMWRDLAGGASMTLFLGVAFLVLMGVANVCYLLGPAVEGWVKPQDPERFRQTAYRMGFWGSIALPFVFPAVNLALLIGH